MACVAWGLGAWVGVGVHGGVGGGALELGNGGQFYWFWSLLALFNKKIRPPASTTTTTRLVTTHYPWCTPWPPTPTAATLHCLHSFFLISALF
jgi:hypothetical protein